MRSRGRRAEEYDPAEVHIQLSREEEVLNDKAETLPQAENFKPSIESTNSSNKKSADVCPECIMWSIRGQA